MIKNIAFLLIFLWFSLACHGLDAQRKINRFSVVERHRVFNESFDTLSSLTVGNGHIAFTVDATGMQSFPNYYRNGVPLGCQSDWGWHSFPNQMKFRKDQYLKTYLLNGKFRSYAVQWHEPDRIKEAADYFRANPHRLQLAGLGMEILLGNGKLAGISDFKNIRQRLDPWTGEIVSRFEIENMPVLVFTYCHFTKDEMAVKVISPLLKKGRIRFVLRYPYPTGTFSDEGCRLGDFPGFFTACQPVSLRHLLSRVKIDTTVYYTKLQSSIPIVLLSGSNEPHCYCFQTLRSDSVSLELLYQPSLIREFPADFNHVASSSQLGWKNYWQQGGMVDFSACQDPRAFELERRMVLSLYLIRTQNAGQNPPQETGLTYNSWYGRPHMEMIIWHSYFYALWGHPELLERQMDWYLRTLSSAKAIASRQGYRGARWPKMTDPDGRETPSSVGAFLIWQQPHLISFAELLYRLHPLHKVLEKWSTAVFATAEFMADYPVFSSGKYHLGPGLIPSQECYDALSTYDPAFEIHYWRWALNVAINWKKRLGLPVPKHWIDLCDSLPVLSQSEGKYLPAASQKDAYHNPRFVTDHPAILSAIGMLPLDSTISLPIMDSTFQWIVQHWNWSKTWGWDYPLLAMAATRLRHPDQALEVLLMPAKSNTYLNNGHNYQDNRLRIYLPGNGGFLSALALMCAGYIGCDTENPGFPQNGKWNILWEGLSPMF